MITGFRVGWSGAQGLYNVQPDLTCLEKSSVAGLPVGAYGGRREIMSLVAPMGPVYQAGTLSGNPLAMTAGLETLKLLQEPGRLREPGSASARLEEGLRAVAKVAEVAVSGNRVGSALTLFFTGQSVTNYASARRAATGQYATFFQAMLRQGVYLAPSQFEAAFVSLAHTDEDIDRTVKAAEQAFRAVRAAG